MDDVQNFILQELYGLSDDQIEFQLLDRLSFQKFIGQGLNKYQMLKRFGCSGILY
ncbi:MAG: transposase [Bacteroidetes bacterium]|nr:transposase [Bacteroidota bacterium]